MSATVVVRKVAAVPIRTASQTWQSIVALLTDTGSPAESLLTSIAGVGSVLVSEEYTSGAAVIVSPSSGPQVRVYTAHGDAAFDVQADETPLALCPTRDAGWSLSLPCGDEDMDEMQAALSNIPNLTVRSLSAATGSTNTSSAGQGRSRLGVFEVNMGEMR